MDLIALLVSLRPLARTGSRSSGDLHSTTTRSSASPTPTRAALLAASDLISLAPHLIAVCGSPGHGLAHRRHPQQRARTHHGHRLVPEPVPALPPPQPLVPPRSRRRRPRPPQARPRQARPREPPPPVRLPHRQPLDPKGRPLHHRHGRRRRLGPARQPRPRRQPRALLALVRRHQEARARAQRRQRRRGRAQRGRRRARRRLVPRAQQGLLVQVRPPSLFPLARSTRS